MQGRKIKSKNGNAYQTIASGQFCQVTPSLEADDTTKITKIKNDSKAQIGNATYKRPRENQPTIPPRMAAAPAM